MWISLPPIGLRHTQHTKVSPALVVPAMRDSFGAFGDLPPVLATAYLVGFSEWACIEALRPYLEPQMGTLGIHIDISHCAATPIGMEIAAEVELIGIHKRRVRFRVTCRDEAGLIGEGFHERAVIERARFESQLAIKRDTMGSGSQHV